ncbi:MAG: DUF924 family protein [Nitrospinota bacterium]
MDEAIGSVLNFWFVENGPKQWFTHVPDFDATIRDRFAGLVDQAAKGELSHWRETARGTLAEIIILDQFPRNLNRGDAGAYGCDTLAVEAARQALKNKVDQAVDEAERVFLYLPFEHSEAAGDQETSVRLCATLSDKSYLDWAEKHKKVIDRFGRYPHRNAVLGRTSTAEELAFLEEEGSFF